MHPYNTNDRPVTACGCNARMYRLFRTLCLICVSVLLSGSGVAQDISIAKPITASSGAGAWHPWYEIHIAPDDASKMLICGSKWNAQDNAIYGFVYYSADGGGSWTQTLEDKRTTWVSEHSCAYGVGGIGYFVSDASKVVDGWAHHELGSTRIYTTRDFGKSWNVGIETGWTDYSTSVVDTSPGVNQNRLYLFFNGLDTFYHSIGQARPADIEMDGVRVALLSYRVGDAHVLGPFRSNEVFKEQGRGEFPAPAFLLGDGSAIVFYTAKHKAEKNLPTYAFNVVRSSGDRRYLETPIKIAEPTKNDDERYGEGCDSFLSSAAGRDPSNGKLYFVYTDVRATRCHLLVTTSTDGGRSWTKPQVMVFPDSKEDDVYASPAIAINQEGVLGVMWEKARGSGCWMFAISEDDGASLSPAQRLGTCGVPREQPKAIANDHFWTMINQAGSSFGGQAGVVQITVHNTHDEVWRNESAMVVAPDGTFHAVWIDARNGESEICTTQIRAVSARGLIAAGTKGLDEVTNEVAVLYGQRQNYDVRSGIITVDLAIKNNGLGSIRGPFRLGISRFNVNYGHASIANSVDHQRGAGAVLDVSSSIPNGVLLPGETSVPFSLKFHYALPSHGEQPETADLLSLGVKIFARTQQFDRKPLR